MECKILAVKDKSFFGRLIGLVQKTEFTHSALLYNGFIYEKPLGKCHKIKEHEYRFKYDYIYSLNIDLPLFEERFNSVLSMKYDYKATLLFYINKWFGTKFQDAKKINCVEFCGIMTGIKELNFNVSPKEMKEVINAY